MKKISICAVAVAALMATSCGMGTTGGTTNGQSTAAAGGAVVGDVLGSILNGATNGQTIGNVLQSVLGLDKVTQQSLIGSWTYVQPGCAFTSENLLAQAGGEAVASSIKQKLATYYQKVGVKSTNTQVVLAQDGTFKATIAGKPWSGRWTFDASTYKVTLTGLLLNINCYAKRNSNGIALLFEASKLLTLLQTMTALSGNSTLQGVGDLSKNYDGLRIGFDFQ